VRKSWLYGLALSLGLVGSTTAFAQYPNANESFGLSSFPVQTEPQAYSPFQNLPQVPTTHANPSALQYGSHNPGQFAAVPGGPAGYYPQGPQAPYGQPMAYAPPVAGHYAPPVTSPYPPTASSPYAPYEAAQSARPSQYPGETGYTWNVPAQQPYAPQYVQQGSSSIPSLRANPQSNPYQLVGTQEQLGGIPTPYPQNLVPQPANVPQPPMPASAGQNMDYSQQSAMDYSQHPYEHSVAPHCSSCGPAPVSGVYPPSYSAPSPCGGTIGGHSGGHHALGGMPCGAKPWFFGGGVLLFNRIDNKNVPLSFADSSYAPDVLGTGDAQMGVMPGFEVMFGRYFNCGRNAIAASYWGLFPEDQYITRAAGMPGDMRSRMPYTYLVMPDNPTTMPVDPYDVYGWYDNAYAHVLQRSSTYHNVEVNLLGFAMGCSARNFNLPTCGGCGGGGCGQCGGSKFATGPCCLTAPACGSRLNLSWLLGFRYFRFEDQLLYAASLQDSVVNRAADDLYYGVNTTNDLFGFQLGSRADYCVGSRLNLYGTAKAGIYGNHSTLCTRIGTDYQTAYLNDTRMPSNPSQGENYMFSESKDSVAFLSELGTGVGFRLTSKWTATAGYRAVIACGVASSVDNVQTSFANYEDIRDYHNFGCLVLHGVNIGALYNF
jgi:hypothetical protein